MIYLGKSRIYFSPQICGKIANMRQNRKYLRGKMNPRLFVTHKTMENCGADILAEIARRLSPPDFLALRRVNRAIKSALDSRAKEIWTFVRENLAQISGEHICAGDFGANLPRNSWREYSREYRAQLWRKLCSSHYNNNQNWEFIGSKMINFRRSETAGTWILDNSIKNAEFIKRLRIGIMITDASNFIQEHFIKESVDISLLINGILVKDFRCEKRKNIWRDTSALNHYVLELSLKDFAEIYVPKSAILTPQKVEVKFSNGLELPPTSRVFLHARFYNPPKYPNLLNFAKKYQKINWFLQKCIISHDIEDSTISVNSYPANLWCLYDVMISHISLARELENL